MTEKAAVQTSKQVRGHILCSDCEHRFDRRGENCVIRNCWRAPDTFPLQEGLKAAAAIAVQGTLRVYRAAEVPQLHIERFVYSGASVYWRAAAHRWHSAAEGQVRLGPYEEGLRRFLLDEAPFPVGMAMLLMISESRAASDNCMLSLPWFAGRSEIHKYRFDIPGISFGLFVGKGAQSIAGLGCAARNGTVVITPEAERERLRTARRIARTPSIKGKLRGLLR